MNSNHHQTIAGAAQVRAEQQAKPLPALQTLQDFLYSKDIQPSADNPLALGPFEGSNIDRLATTASEFLAKAYALLTARGKQYDQPQGARSMGKTVAAFNTITGRDLSEAEGWLLLQLLKDVRQWQNPDKYHADSAEDCVSYAALKAESLARTA